MRRSFILSARMGRMKEKTPSCNRSNTCMAAIIRMMRTAGHHAAFMSMALNSHTVNSLSKD